MRGRFTKAIRDFAHGEFTLFRLLLVVAALAVLIATLLDCPFLTTE